MTIMKRLLRMVFIATLTLLLFGGLTSGIHAQDLTSMTVKEHADAARSDQPQNMTKFTFEGFDALGAGIGLGITGAKNVTVGALPQTTSYLAGIIFNPPIQTHEYVADVLQNIGIVKPAYAQGIGFAGLNPVLTVWKAFRNLAYFCFIIIFVVIGFMIMFRTKINSNTIATIQESLPKIIVTLLLITFSYAIGGLVIDLMYLSIFVLIGLLQQVGIVTNSANTLNVIFGKNIIGIAFTYFMGWREITGVGAEAIGSIVSEAFGGLAGFITNGLAWAILAVAVLIAVFRTLFQLVVAYVGIILSVVFAPLQLLPNAFPGSSAFSKWIKGLIANAAVFPAVVMMIIIGISLTGSYGARDMESIGMPVTEGEGTGFSYGGFIPPLITWQNGGQSGSGSAGAIRSVIGLGIILLLPEVVKMVKKAFEIKDEGYGEVAWKGAMAGYEKSGMKTLANIPGTYVKTAGGFVMNAFGMRGAEKAVDVAQKAGLVTQELKANIIDSIHQTDIARSRLASKLQDQFKPKEPKKTKPDGTIVE